MSEPVSTEIPDPQLSPARGGPTDQYALSTNSSLVLDVLRASASQAVVVGHGIATFSLWPALLPPRAPFMQDIAVVVFFVLSGLLITYATLRKPSTYGFREFFIDRFARIYPAFLVVLPLVFIIDRVSISLGTSGYPFRASLDFGSFITNVFMLQLPQVTTHFGLAGAPFGSARPLWTLALEWWIYMCFGWLVLRGRKKAAFWLPVMACVAFIPAYFSVVGSGLVHMWIVASGIYFVLAGRRLANAPKASLVVGMVGFATLACVLLARTKQPYDTKFAVLLCAALVCVIVLADRTSFEAPAKLAAVIRVFAGFSFTLYLLHYPVLYFLYLHPLFGSSQANFWTALVIANLASVAIASVTEMHHRAHGAWLKAKFARDPGHRFRA